MNILKNDKFMLIEAIEKLNKVGEIYEVGNVTNTAVVMRDARTKVAVGAVDIDDFGKYFKKAEEVRTWTKWCAMNNPLGEIIAFYRTNGKKVQVRMSHLETIRGEASCLKGDEFNLAFGIRLAYARCVDKELTKAESEFESAWKEMRSRRIDNQRDIKKMIRSLYGNEDVE